MRYSCVCVGNYYWTRTETFVREHCWYVRTNLFGPCVVVVLVAAVFMVMGPAVLFSYQTGYMRACCSKLSKLLLVNLGVRNLHFCCLESC